MRQHMAQLAEKYGRMAHFRHHRRAAQLFYGSAFLLDGERAFARREFYRIKRLHGSQREALRFVALGTTGICNASCVHCPTGKAITAHVPRTTMPMELYRKVIDGIVEEGLEVVNLAFGLFGDGLVDPLVIERARYAKQALPDVMLDVNTNGAAFDEKKHAALNEHISLLTLHCESLRAETYDMLMTPLRLKNVFPKYQRILDAFPGKVRISVPVSRANIDQIEEIREWFVARGAMEVAFDPMSSRCAEDRSVFDRLSLAPVAIRCRPDVMSDLIVDCDGMVLSCCQDFERREPIGDVAKQSFRETLDDLRRERFRLALAEDRHDELSTCTRCYGDGRTPDFPFDWAPTDLQVRKPEPVM